MGPPSSWSIRRDARRILKRAMACLCTGAMRIRRRLRSGIRGGVPALRAFVWLYAQPAGEAQVTAAAAAGRPVQKSAREQPSTEGRLARRGRSRASPARSRNGLAGMRKPAVMRRRVPMLHQIRRSGRSYAGVALHCSCLPPSDASDPSFGAPVPDEPTNSLHPFGKVTSRPLALQVFTLVLGWMSQRASLDW